MVFIKSFGFINKVPQDPIPPAFATAADSDTGQTPAIGDNIIGISRLKTSANFLARTYALFDFTI